MIPEPTQTMLQRSSSCFFIVKKICCIKKYNLKYQILVICPILQRDIIKNITFLNKVFMNVCMLSLRFISLYCVCVCLANWGPIKALLCVHCFQLCIQQFCYFQSHCVFIFCQFIQSAFLLFATTFQLNFETQLPYQYLFSLDPAIWEVLPRAGNEYY